MKDYLNEINNLFPIRRRAEQKSRFYDYVRSELGAERVKKEILEKKPKDVPRHPKYLWPF